MKSPRLFSLFAGGPGTGRALRRAASLGVIGLTLSLSADTTVPPTNVASGQTLSVTDPGQVTTSGGVQVQSGGAAILQGGTRVLLAPGFHALAGSYFRAYIDRNLGGFANLADTDVDGLPDLWELLHFGSLTAATGAGDNDGDGVLNAAEYVAGTNPKWNDAAGPMPADTLVVIRVPSGSYRKVMSNWSIVGAP